jgi:hypothetical protein
VGEVDGRVFRLMVIGRSPGFIAGETDTGGTNSPRVGWTRGRTCRGATAAAVAWALSGTRAAGSPVRRSAAPITANTGTGTTSATTTSTTPIFHRSRSESRVVLGAVVAPTASSP